MNNVVNIIDDPLPQKCPLCKTYYLNENEKICSECTKALKDFNEAKARNRNVNIIANRNVDNLDINVNVNRNIDIYGENEIVPIPISFVSNDYFQSLRGITELKAIETAINLDINGAGRFFEDWREALHADDPLLNMKRIARTLLTRSLTSRTVHVGFDKYSANTITDLENRSNNNIVGWVIEPEDIEPNWYSPILRGHQVVKQNQVIAFYGMNNVSFNGQIDLVRIRFDGRRIKSVWNTEELVQRLFYQHDDQNEFINTQSGLVDSPIIYSSNERIQISALYNKRMTELQQLVFYTVLVEGTI